MFYILILHYSQSETNNTTSEESLLLRKLILGIQAHNAAKA